MGDIYKKPYKDLGGDNHRIHYSVVFGENVRVGFGTVIEKNCKIGDNTIIGHNCVIRPNTIIGKDCLIGHCGVYEGHTTIGDNTVVHAQCHLTSYVTIEDHVWIGMGVIFTNTKTIVHGRNIPLVYEKPIVRRGARIGAGTNIVPGIEIGENSFVGMGSLVTKNIPPKELWFGNPAKYFRDVPEDEWL